MIRERPNQCFFPADDETLAMVGEGQVDVPYLFDACDPVLQTPSLPYIARMHDSVSGNSTRAFVLPNPFPRRCSRGERRW